MDSRQLTFTTQELQDKGIYLQGPAVLSFRDDVDAPVFMPVYGMGVETLDDAPNAVVYSINGNRYYPLVRAQDVHLNAQRGDITFSSYGKIYTVRAFVDTDGLWASQLHTNVPAQALEERLMTEVETAFSPDAPADDENLYAAVDTDTNQVKYLVYSNDSGLYIRDNKNWHTLAEGDDSLDDLEVDEVDPKFTKIFDMSQANDEPILADDLAQYALPFNVGPVTAAGDAKGDTCPVATQDIGVNLTNRQHAIDTAEYGPLNPKEPNDDFWQKKADRWGVTSDDARKSVCGNCVMFIRTKKMLDCIEGGLAAGDSGAQNAWDAIDTAELGYCEAFDFKCAASRTCNAWVVGGPITDDSQAPEEQQ